MLAIVPFLIGGQTFGVISLVIFLSAVIILTIPVFATRGRAQAVWLGVSGLLLLALGATLVTLTYLVGQERILQ